ncbi:hypothetical protein K431DRAFT_282166 [Polychaeton citri CBS 116435]|uniref:Altered inheritance of mitochondria protein 24, mitochondrial n=1 Tax=Polychaeton citri CBS 116435 TaxID=1314669 RepID=A0A9P4UT29_9PEZI|nr:hypothetical protein K431DRAFT_282166 [Polychaeton citri CBS 116435]
MRRQALDNVCSACRHQTRRRILQHYHPRPLHTYNRKYVHISSTPSTTSDTPQTLDIASTSSNSTSSSTPQADARFEVLGNTFSLLSASISASQNLYTRKGTLVGFNGKPENAVSTLSVLKPFRRAFLGIPFVYQRVSSTTPYTALIATKNAVTSMVVVHLDGRLDWMVAQRNAIVAWTGHTLSLSPRTNTKMSLSHWGNTQLTGRGLLALSGKGQIHRISLKTGDEYVVHPSNVIAYSMMQHAPQPYRFKANLLRFQIPSPTTWLSDTRFFTEMRKTRTYLYARDIAFTIRTWARRTIWGDRLFLHFKGPCQILIQSRGSSIRNVLTNRDVNEIADSPAGAVPGALKPAGEAGVLVEGKPQPGPSRTKLSYVTVERGGKAKFDQAPGTGKSGEVASPADV